MSMGYIAFVLSQQSQEALLARFSPSFVRVIAHHVTLAFGCTEEVLPLVLAQLGWEPGQQDVTVVDYYQSTEVGVDCVTVSINGNEEREDGSRYHVTLSVAAGVSPVASNKIVTGVPARGRSVGLPLTGEIQFIPFTR